MQISIIAHPNSKNPRVDEDIFGHIHVHVDAPPLEGKANKAVIEALSAHYGVAKSMVKLMQGEKSKLKRLEITLPGKVKH